jgi:hypothetical protein
MLRPFAPRNKMSLSGSLRMTNTEEDTHVLSLKKKKKKLILEFKLHEKIVSPNYMELALAIIHATT